MYIFVTMDNVRFCSSVDLFQPWTLQGEYTENPSTVGRIDSLINWKNPQV